jgi:hypothetical protein
MSKMFVMSKMLIMSKIDVKDVKDARDVKDVTMSMMFTRSKMFSIQFQNFEMVSMSKILYTRFSFCSVYRKLTMSVNMIPPDQ